MFCVVASEMLLDDIKTVNNNIHQQQQFKSNTK